MNEKVVFLSNSLTNGGAERVLSIILSELYRQNIHVELICLEKDNFYDLPKGIKITYLSDFNGLEHGLIKLFYLPILAIRLKKIIRDNNINMIQSHLYRASYVNTLARLFGSRHMVEIVNPGLISYYKTEGLLGRINLFLIKNLYPLADVIICKSHGMLYDLEMLFRMKNDKLVINNPYNIEKIQMLSSENVDDFIFESNKKYLIYAGRFESFKRPEHVIQALSEIEDSSVELLLLGDGPDTSKLVKLTNVLGLENRVHFLGKVKNPYKYMKRANIFILSSLNGEGFPNVLVEAMICKTPVIATDCKSGPREILAPGTKIDFELKDDIEMAEYGVLTPMNDVKNLAKAIKSLIENSDLSEQYVEKAFERAQTFAIDKIIEQYKKVLNLN